ncbi:copper chaperone PCu(A)C [Modestobacter altitudinis]|uniref:copper chaperone PCu(A)C n=1 Tax=Modestobacter altitudinis TaxID=2213158 RepID=UPI00110CD7C1|nr:copper chaperone PCu(A)C [Modestobacter altitudinis]
MTTQRRATVPGRRWLLAVTAVAVTGVAGCGEDAPLNTPPDEVRGGAIGPDAPVSEDVKLLQVQLEYPLDGVYEVGEDARLFLGIANTGTTAATLTDVSGPDFTDGASADGGDVDVTVAPNDNVYVGAEGMPVIVLEDLDTELRSSESIPVTFTFEEAGEVTVDAVVAAERQDPLPTYDFPDPAEDPSPDVG